MVEQADENDRGSEMADDERDHSGVTGTSEPKPAPFRARLVANLALGLELQRAHRSRLTAA